MAHGEGGLETYISIDVETNGRIPGKNSMLSIGAAAFAEDGYLIDTFSENLTPLPFAEEDLETMRWWGSQPKAWAECQKNQEDPEMTMYRFSRWIKGLPGTPVIVGYPVVFDFMFVYWYLIYFIGESPFGYGALDIKSYAVGLTGGRFHDFHKSALDQWMDGVDTAEDLSHIAVEDAIRQGKIFMNMRKSAKKRTS